MKRKLFTLLILAGLLTMSALFVSVEASDDLQGSMDMSTGAITIDSFDSRLTPTGLCALKLPLPSVFFSLKPNLLAPYTLNKAQDSCVTRCNDKSRSCGTEAAGVYNTCRQQGGSDSYCTDKKRTAYLNCMMFYGCQTCLGGQWPAHTYSYYCACGDPGGPGQETCGLTFDGGYSNSCDCDPYDPTCTSPILVDAANNGYRLTNAANGVRFDLRADGSALQTAWTEPDSDDAWLALDRNGNGAIDNGAELFGNFTPQPERVDKNGFLALAEYDKVANGGNADGQITPADSIFALLRLWQDRNHNGISEPSELAALPSVGLNVLELQYKETRRMDRYANVFRYKAKSGWGWDVFLTHE